MASTDDPAVPPAVRPELRDMERVLNTAVERLIQPVSEVVRTANLARIAARSDPPAAAIPKIKQAAASIRAAATTKR